MAKCAQVEHSPRHVMVPSSLQQHQTIVARVLPNTQSQVAGGQFKPTIIAVEQLAQRQYCSSARPPFVRQQHSKMVLVYAIGTPEVWLLAGQNFVPQHPGPKDNHSL